MTLLKAALQFWGNLDPISRIILKMLLKFLAKRLVIPFLRRTWKKLTAYKRE